MRNLQPNVQVFDVFPFYNELDLLELRLRTLWNVVDKFVLTECTETFSGKPKEMFYFENRERFLKYKQKIIYNPVDGPALESLREQRWVTMVTDFDATFPYKHGGKPARMLHSSVKREINQRDAGILGLSQYANDGDVIFLSDVDEIPKPETITKVINKGITRPLYFKMDWFSYWINNRVDRDWFGTVAFKYEMLKGSSLDIFRYGSSDETNLPGPLINDGGWHFSYLGGSDVIEAKLDALAYQGLRAEFSKFFNKFRRKGWQVILNRNSDLLLQNRTFSLVPLDEKFPYEIARMDGFVDKYYKPLV